MVITYKSQYVIAFLCVCFHYKHDLSAFSSDLKLTAVFHSKEKLYFLYNTLKDQLAKKKNLVVECRQDTQYKMLEGYMSESGRQHMNHVT